jgi:protein-S-isoprenylcysteine O-methyltransferase Ste14
MGVYMAKQLIPPSYFNLFILLAIILHFVFPIKIILHLPIILIGILPIIIGLFINLQANKTMRQNRTSTNFFEKPVNLIIDGPFRYSRNPIYLGGVIFSFGLAILLGSLISFIFPFILFLLLNFLYIPQEEKRLKKIFGREYLIYMKKVRRWI